MTELSGASWACKKENYVKRMVKQIINTQSWAWGGGGGGALTSQLDAPCRWGLKI